MTKKAIAYVSDIMLGRTGEVICCKDQKECIQKYAKANDIEIVGWFSDEMYNEDVFSRGGIQELLAFDTPYDMLLVERVWSISRCWPTLKTFYAEVLSRGKEVESATILWDCISQMSRRHFDGTMNKYRQACTRVPRKEVAKAKVRKPARLHFSFKKKHA